MAHRWLRLARRAGECYNRGVKEQQPTNPEQSTPSEAEVDMYEGQRDVDTKLDGFEARLTAKVDGLDSKVDRLRTEVKAEIAVERAKVNAGLKAIERELTIIRWAFLFLLGPLSLLAILGLAELIKRWFD